MKSKKGMTLIEIIIALAILGIISVGFIGGMSNTLIMMFRTQAITEDLFHTQKDVEGKMEHIREQLWRSGKSYKTGEVVIYEDKKYRVSINHSSNIFPNDLATGNLQNYSSIPSEEVFKISNMFGEANLNITGLLINHSHGRSDIKTVVSHEKIEFKMPVLETVESKFIGGDSSDFTYLKDGISIQGNALLDNKTLDVFMKNIYGWYVSREGFNISHMDNVTEPEWGVHFPIFPDDYKIIPGATNSTLGNLDKYNGRFLVMTATPASKVGKLGTMASSKPIYIHGLDKRSFNNLKHIDASQYKTAPAGSNLEKYFFSDIDNNKRSVQGFINYSFIEPVDKNLTVFAIGFQNQVRSLEILKIGELEDLGSISLDSLSFISLDNQNIRIGKAGVGISEIIICKDITEEQEIYITEYLKNRYLLD